MVEEGPGAVSNDPPAVEPKPGYDFSVVQGFQVVNRAVDAERGHSRNGLKDGGKLARNRLASHLELRRQVNGFPFFDGKRDGADCPRCRRRAISEQFHQARQRVALRRRSDECFVDDPLLVKRQHIRQVGPELDDRHLIVGTAAFLPGRA